MLSHPDSTPPILEPKLEQKQTIEVTLAYTKGKGYSGSLSLTFPSKEEGIRFFDYMKKSSPDNLQNINVDQTTGIITLTTFSRNPSEFNVNLGSYEAVLSFVAGLGLNSRAMRLSETPQPDEAQISERYTEAGITHYRAITPYALPIEEKLPFSEYFQQTKLYFDKEKISKGLTLTIPTAQALLSLPEPIPYFTVPSILYSIINAPKKNYFSSSETKPSYASPNVKLQLTSTGALAVEFPSNEMAIFALSMLRLAPIPSDLEHAPLIKKQLPKATDNIFPYINPINSKQLLIPIDTKDTQKPTLILSTINARILLSLLNPKYQQQGAGYEFPLTLDTKSNVCLRKQEFDALKAKKILRIFLSYESLLTAPELFINYSHMADQMKLKQPVRNLFNTYLNFARKKIIDLEKEAEKTVSLLPTSAKKLIENFLAFKKEQQPAIFASMSLNDYIARLLYNRPACFYGTSDQYLLWDGTEGSDESFKDLDPNLYLQYDEIPFAALLILWSKTHFINNGRYDNNGEVDRDDTYAKDGIVCSIVGARLEKEEVCEYRHMFITPKQNTTKNGYGKEAKPKEHATQINRLWASFYGLKSENLLSYEEALQDQKEHPERYLVLQSGDLFNLEICVKRYYILIETYLRKLNQDAKEAKKTAYDEALSFGTGCWAPYDISYVINAIFPMVYALVVKNNDLSHISHINLPFLSIEEQDKRCGSAKNGEQITDKNGHPITIHFHDHPPQSILEEKHRGDLRKRSIAWDGNAQIGNELYLDNFDGSGDPVGATASLVPLYQNPRINKKLHEGMKKGEKIQFHGEEKSPNVDSILEGRNWQALVVGFNKKQKERPSSTAAITTTMTSSTTSTMSSTQTTTPTMPETKPESLFSSTVTTFTPPHTSLHMPHSELQETIKITPDKRS